MAKFSAVILFSSARLKVICSRLTVYFSNNALCDGNNNIRSCNDLSNLASNSSHLHHSEKRYESNENQSNEFCHRNYKSS